MELTHFNSSGRAKMVDVQKKEITKRCAVAKGYIKMKEETLNRILEGTINKGDVLAVAQIAGIIAAKNTSGSIPMCHPLMLTGIDINFEIKEKENVIDIEAIINSEGKTGVEMEALSAVSITALTIYDMCKSIDKDMVINNIRLTKKSGGKSGIYTRKE